MISHIQGDVCASSRTRTRCTRSVRKDSTGLHARRTPIAAAARAYQTRRAIFLRPGCQAAAVEGVQSCKIILHSYPKIETV